MELRKALHNSEQYLERQRALDKWYIKESLQADRRAFDSSSNSLSSSRFDFLQLQSTNSFQSIVHGAKTNSIE